MDNNTIRRFQVKLLRGGVSPKYVFRTVKELQDHYQDSKKDLMQSGLTEVEAAGMAMGNLGDLDALCEHILNRKDLRSFTSTHPLLTHLLLPTLGLILITVATVFLIMGLVDLQTTLFTEAGHNRPPYWLQLSVDSMVFFIRHVLTALILLSLVYYSVSRYISTKILISAVLIFSFLGAGLVTDVILPDPQGNGGAVIASWGYEFLPIPNNDRGGNLLRLLLNLLMAGACWGYLRRRMSLRLA